MSNVYGKRVATVLLMFALSLVNFVVLGSMPVIAADHAEANAVADDPGADLGDTFAFLNPNDNTRVVLAMTVAGFIVPAEQVNLGYFPSRIVYRFEIENTGDARADRFIDIQFSEQTSRTVPQTASIYLRGRDRRRSFTALTTLPRLAPTPNPFVVTTVNGVSFFAGMTDDPFYFDIPAFSRFVTSVLGGNPDPTQLNRARDSFAGYNIHTIAIELPVTALQGSAGNIIGVNAVTLRPRRGGSGDDDDDLGGDDDDDGDGLEQADRGAIPAVNTALIPFPRKNEFNRASTRDDANGRFAGDIVATLTALGTNATNIGILAQVAVTNGDILRLNTATPNL